MGLPVPVTVALPPPEDRSFADVWSALGGELKPSLDVVVSAPTDTGQRYDAGPPVTTPPRISLGGSGGWPPRSRRAGRTDAGVAERAAARGTRPTARPGRPNGAPGQARRADGAEERRNGRAGAGTRAVGRAPGRRPSDAESSPDPPVAPGPEDGRGRAVGAGRPPRTAAGGGRGSPRE